MPDFKDRADKNKQKAKASEGMALEIRQMDRAEQQRNLAAISPDRVTEPRCTVCMHPQRDYIEAMLAQGHSYSGIAAHVGGSLERRAISNHYKKHMDLQDAAIREVLENEVDRLGNLHEEGVRDIITTRGVLEVLLRKGFKDASEGITTVEPKDLIQIAKMLHDMDSHVSESAVAELQAQVEIFMEAIKVVCSPAQQTEIAAEVRKLAEREGFSADMDAALEDVTVDAEVVDA